MPGVFSQGETFEELEENIREAYLLMMEEEKEVLPRAGVQTKELKMSNSQISLLVKERGDSYENQI